jgi:WD40 repeat protein
LCPISHSIEWTQTPLPPTKRAYGIHTNVGALNDKVDGKATPKLKICYGTGNIGVIRDVEDAAQMTLITGHSAKVTVVTPAPNGNWVASGDDTGVVNVWGYPNMMLKNTLRIGACINDLRWSADSAMIVAAGNGSTEFAKAFRFDSQNQLGKIDRMTKQVLSIDWSPIKPARIALTDEDKSVLFYTGVPFKYDSRSELHSRYPNVVRYAPDGSVFATVGSDSKVIIYDGKTGVLVKVLEAGADNHTGSIFGLAWHKDSKELVTAAADKMIKIWNVEESKVVHTWTAASGGNAGIDDQQSSVMWSPSENPISVSLSGTFSYWSRDSETPVKVIYGHHSNIQSKVYDRAGKKLYTADLEGRIIVTDAETGAMSVFAGDGHAGKPISALALSADGKTLYSAGYDGTIQKTVAADKKFGSIVKASAVNIKSLVVAPSGTIYAALSSGSVVSIDQSGEQIAQVSFPADNLVLSPNGSKLYALSAQKKLVTVYDADLKVVASPENSYGGAPNALVETANGNVIYNENENLLPMKPDLSGQAGFGWTFHTAGINSLSISPNGKLLASAAADKALIIWKDLETFKSANTVLREIHPTGYSFVDWIDDETVITISQDGVIKRNKLLF